MVHPEYQKQGIGKKVMQALLKKCDKEGIKWVQLFCAKGCFYNYSLFIIIYYEPVLELTGS